VLCLDTLGISPRAIPPQGEAGKPRTRAATGQRSTDQGNQMDMSTGALLTSLLVSSVGFGIFRYGKVQSRAPQILGGIALMGSPYLVSGALATLVVAGALVLVMMLVVRQGM
jgi:hypothetical protein